MRVVLLGAGRMATALANSLGEVTPLPARATPARPPGRARCVWILCVPDAALPAVCAAWAAVMRKGEIVELKTAADLFARPEHPYTRDLLAAVPSGEAA